MIKFQADFVNLGCSSFELDILRTQPKIIDFVRLGCSTFKLKFVILGAQNLKFVRLKCSNFLKMCETWMIQIQWHFVGFVCPKSMIFRVQMLKFHAGFVRPGYSSTELNTIRIRCSESLISKDLDAYN